MLGLLITAVVWRVAESAEGERIQAEFHRRAEAQFQFAQQRLRLYIEMVHGLRNFLFWQQYVTREEFHLIAADSFRRHPAIQALQWVPHVPAAQRAEFEAEATRQHGRPFHIRQRDPAGTFQLAPERAEYLPILYTEPLEGNATVLGYDILTAPTAPSLRRARESRELVVTQQFRLAQLRHPQDEYGVVIAVPVFTAGAEPRFAGLAQCVFRVETMLSQAHRDRPDEALWLYYVDLDASPGAPAVLYANEAGTEPLRTRGRAEVRAPAPRSGQFRELIEIGGRRWAFVAAVDDAWYLDQRSLDPGLLLSGGVALALIGSLLVNTLLQRTARIEAEVADRTAELQTARRLLEDDIQQREETELRLRESEARLQAVLDNSPNPLFVKDPEGRYLLFNQPFAELCRRRDDGIVGRTDFDLFPEAQAKALRANDLAVLHAGAARSFEETTASAGGPRTSIVQKFPLRDAHGKIYALGGIVTDITDRVSAETERREMERRLTASQKLESLGVLAGGIAHDFNNILTAVLGNASLARQLAAAGTVPEAQLGQIEDAARRAADLCQQMLAYAGKGRVVTDRVDLNEIVRGTASLLEVSISKNIRLELRLADRLPPVMADATQLRQIVMNLVINAGDAITESTSAPGGRILVATGARDVEPAELGRAIGHPRLPGGRYVVLEVADNGCGMTPETLTRIFEPFFTTKFSGRGLGLSAVLGIMQSHRGGLFVESAPGAGSTFRLLLPAASGEPAPSGPSAAPPKPARLSGTVLVVDDEQAVRDITRAALEAFGLTVITAASGEEAVSLCRRLGDGINLVLVDLTMPGISGEETVRRIRLINARPAIVLMSGYSESDATQRVGHLGVAGFLQKPFELDGLLARIRDHLE